MNIRILEYSGLDTKGLNSAYQKAKTSIACGDFRAAQVKKLSHLTQGKFYRARLNDADRLLFILPRHGEQVCALMLEVIRNHDYEKSRFLRGAVIDENKISDNDFSSADVEEAPLLRCLHPEKTQVHLLDKPISFDDVQELIYRKPAPLVVVGSAGSGKTALTLKKMKNSEGQVLYVTHSSYLAQSARDLYYANGFEHSHQGATFLSYREFIESIHVPLGREAQWRDFAAWFSRMRPNYRDIDPHQAFEEIRGVMTASHEEVLSRPVYIDLGIRQSIFSQQQRDTVYDLFEKYRAWLQEQELFDLNLVAHDWKSRAKPIYDFVVVDEVQDVTPVQLTLVLKLVANFRNGQETTRIANQLLKIKQKRFGSIDRESNFLVQAGGSDSGQVNLLADKDAVKKDLDIQTRKSTRFAVLVMREEDKLEAKKYFSTPLLFSIHEAKGLEYENIILYRFVSDYRAQFNAIVEGVNHADMDIEALDYKRAKDKSDKSLETYKFFINAFYVAITRAVKNLDIIDTDIEHPLFSLLGLSATTQLKVEARQASVEDWQKEARKLELQGKQEQADEIRKTLLKQTPVPWPVFDQGRTQDLLLKVFVDQAPSIKLRQQLYDIAVCHDLPELAAALVRQARFAPALSFQQQRPLLARKAYLTYFSKNHKDILRQCEVHGIEHRLPMNINLYSQSQPAQTTAARSWILR